MEITPNREECNYDVYLTWYDDHYESSLTDDVATILFKSNRYKSRDIWAVMKFETNKASYLAGETRITNGQVMEISSILCRNSLFQLKMNLAGTHGPVSDQQIHEQMCNDHCLLSDELREVAMLTSGCNCIHLSDHRPENHFIRVGNHWCFQNSARILCEELEICGTWKCAPDDFQCPRRDYNFREIPIKGRGDECSGSSILLVSHYFIFLITFFSIS